MATYAFKALDLAGAPTQGRDGGRRQAGGAAQLRSKGLIVVDIEEQAPANAGDILGASARQGARPRVATRQLATMVHSGMSLLRALYVLEEQTENDKLREASSTSARTSRRGSRCPTRSRASRRLQRALRGDGAGRRDRRHPGRHPGPRRRPAREGRRAAAPGQGGDDLPGGDRRLRADRAVRLVAFLVPVFEQIFEDFGGELPAITKFTVGLSDMVTGFWYMLIAVVVGGVFAFRRGSGPSAAACSGTA